VSAVAEEAVAPSKVHRQAGRALNTARSGAKKSRGAAGWVTARTRRMTDPVAPARAIFVT